MFFVYVYVYVCVCMCENVFERVYVKGGGVEDRRVTAPPLEMFYIFSFLSIFGRSPNFSKNSEPSLNLRGTREKKIEQEREGRGEGFLLRMFWMENEEQGHRHLISL